MRLDIFTLQTLKTKLLEEKTKDNYMWEAPMNHMIDWTDQRLAGAESKNVYEDLVKKIIKEKCMDDDTLKQIMRDLDWNEVAINYEFSNNEGETNGND